MRRDGRSVRSTTCQVHLSVKQTPYALPPLLLSPLSSHLPHYSLQKSPPHSLHSSEPCRRGESSWCPAKSPAPPLCFFLSSSSPVSLSSSPQPELAGLSSAGWFRMETSTVAWTAGVAALGVLYWFVWVMGAAEVQGKRGVDLKMGSITDANVKDKYTQYWSFFRAPKETAATPASAASVPAFVDTFYNLVTDIYEWGWGQSFHFSPALPNMSDRDATRAHEHRVADLLKAKPGHRLLDVGCGVGGPMRAIAAHSGSKVVGITINEYQVNRARSHNRKAGLDSQCEVVCGNFMAMPFDAASFDGAYSIEATCHAPRLNDVYGEVYRVLKPGALYVSYEWVTTPLYRADDPAHVEAIHGIERGDALPGLRRYDEIAAVAKEVGFEVVQELDLALPPALPWWTRLKMGRLAYWRNSLVVRVLTLLRIAPKGVVEVHEMLFETAKHLTLGGETGIFTPMHMVLLRKPANSDDDQSK